MKPQTAVIYDHLASVGTITNIEAQALYRCRSLTKRISELKADGFDIKSEWKRDHTGQRYVRYWLRKKEPNEVLPKADFVSADFYSAYLAEFLAGDPEAVICMFVWGESPQGFDYWQAVYTDGTSCPHYGEAKATLVRWGELLKQKEAA